MELALVLLKVLGVLISGVFGVLGTVVRIRDRAGDLTNKGKTFIAGSVAGLLLAVVSQIFESYTQREAQQAAAAESLESTRRLELIVTELNRTLQPISPLEVYISGSKVSLDDEVFSAYKERLNSGIESFLKKSKLEQMKDKNFSTPSVKSERGVLVPLNIEISPSSKFYPTMARDFRVRSLIFPTCYNFVFIKTPIPSETFLPTAHYGSSNGDLRVGFWFPQDLSLVKDLATGEYKVSGSLKSDQARWEDNTGKIVSLPDLAGSQLFVSGCGRSKFTTNSFTKNEKVLPDVDVKMALGTVKIEIGKRSIWINESKFQRHESELGVYWEYLFPETQAELTKAFAGE